VDQTAANMQAEPQKPQDQKNNKNRPKHGNLLFTPKGISSRSQENCFAQTDEGIDLLPHRTAAGAE
jgi:hypothetical protein